MNCSAGKHVNNSLVDLCLGCKVNTDFSWYRSRETTSNKIHIKGTAHLFLLQLKLFLSRFLDTDTQLSL